MNAIKILRSNLVGSFISSFSVGDTWDFYVDGYWLIAQNVAAESEALINDFLKNNYRYFQDAVDNEYISKSAIVASAMRREILGIEISESSTLSIELEAGFKLVIPANVDIVDWQWCLNKTGQDPYIDYIVACFGEGDVKVNADED